MTLWTMAFLGGVAAVVPKGDRGFQSTNHRSLSSGATWAASKEAEGSEGKRVHQWPVPHLPTLLPRPRSVVLLGGAFIEVAEVSVVCTGGVDTADVAWLAQFERTARARLTSTSASDSVVGSAAAKTRATGRGFVKVRVTLLENTDSLPATAVDEHGPIAGPEAYVLELREGVLNLWGRRAGLTHGLHTAQQLLRLRANQAPLPALRIVDSPVYTYRGVMVDTARQPHSFLFHMAMLDQLAANKLNIYQLHASDGGPPPSLQHHTRLIPCDEWSGLGACAPLGFAAGPPSCLPACLPPRPPILPSSFISPQTLSPPSQITGVTNCTFVGGADDGYSLPSAAFPTLPLPTALNHTEVAALQAKAATLGIEIVAEVDLPGHSAALRSKIPSVAARNAKTGAPCNQINITSPEVIATLQTLLGEVMTMFPGRWHHLGADEVSYDVDCGMTKITYHNFINTMNTFVQSRNRTMIVWEGFDPNPGETAANISTDVVVSPFDAVHLTPWPHRPHHYYDAGYNILNTDWNPLYLVRGSVGFFAGPDALAAWNPTKCVPVGADVPLFTCSPPLFTASCCSLCALGTLFWHGYMVGMAITRTSARRPTTGSPSQRTTGIRTHTGHDSQTRTRRAGPMPPASRPRTFRSRSHQTAFSAALFAVGETQRASKCRYFLAIVLARAACTRPRLLGPSGHGPPRAERSWASGCGRARLPPARMCSSALDARTGIRPPRPPRRRRPHPAARSTLRKGPAAMPQATSVTDWTTEATHH